MNRNKYVNGRIKRLRVNNIHQALGDVTIIPFKNILFLPGKGIFLRLELEEISLINRFWVAGDDARDFKLLHSHWLIYSSPIGSGSHEHYFFGF